MKKKKLSELKQLEDEGKLSLYYLDESGFVASLVFLGWQDIGEYLSIDSRKNSAFKCLGNYESAKHSSCLCFQSRLLILM
jgi:hypothetical protein